MAINFNQLISAIRSQLHFSQISAWLATDSGRKLSTKNLHYRITTPGETYEVSKFTKKAVRHNFPLTDVGGGVAVSVTYLSAPRTATIPDVECRKCGIVPKKEEEDVKKEEEMKHVERKILDDRMHTSCTLKGKHRCEDFEEFEVGKHVSVIL